MFKAEWDCMDKMNQFEEDYIQDNNLLPGSIKEVCARLNERREFEDHIFEVETSRTIVRRGKGE